VTKRVFSISASLATYRSMRMCIAGTFDMRPTTVPVASRDQAVPHMEYNLADLT
jgi:hypothetical protein